MWVHATLVAPAFDAIERASARHVQVIRARVMVWYAAMMRIMMASIVSSLPYLSESALLPMADLCLATGRSCQAENTRRLAHSLPLGPAVGSATAVAAITSSTSAFQECEIPGAVPTLANPGVALHESIGRGQTPPLPCISVTSAACAYGDREGKRRRGSGMDVFTSECGV